MNHSLFVLPAISLVTCVILSGCGKQPEAKFTGSGDSLAVVGTEKISADELLLEMRFDAGRGTEAERKAKAMGELMRRKRLVAAARDRGIAGNAEVQRAIDSILISHLLENELQPQLDSISVSDDDVEAYYKAHRERFALPATTTLAILFRASRKADAGRRSEHRDAIAEAIEETKSLEIPVGEGFGKVAMRNSEHQSSRYRGGIIAPVGKDQPAGTLEAMLLAGAEGVETGRFTEMIERPEGIYVVRVVERNASSYQAFDTVRTQIQRELAAQRESELRQNFYADNAREFPGKVLQSIRSTPTINTASARQAVVIR